MLNKLIDSLCPQCKSKYLRLISVKDEIFEEENDWNCTPYREYIEERPLDNAIKGQESEYEEEIDLYKTYGGD